MEAFLAEAWKVLNDHSRWIVWNLFLAFIPLALSFWLFDWNYRSRSILWCMGFLVFIAFLPNAPYVLTDIVHLISAVFNGYSVWVIILAVLPLHLLAILTGFEAYVLSVMNLGHYLHRRGSDQLIIWAELTAHALCAVGIYLGRFKRFNTWDLMIQPNTLITSALGDFTVKNVIEIVAIAFVVITGLYWLMKQITLKLLLQIHQHSSGGKIRKQAINTKINNSNILNSSEQYQSDILESSKKKLYPIEEFKVFTYLHNCQPENQSMVNFSGIVIQLEEIINFLKQEMLLKDICQNILHQKIIEKTAQERSITVTSEEIQVEADKIRYAKYTKLLNKPLDIRTWLEEQMVTLNDWEAGIRANLLAQKLAEHLFAQDVESFFAQNRSFFDKFILYQIVVDYEIVAKKLFYEIRDRKISFFEAAYLYDVDEQRRYKCGYEGKLSLGNLQPDLAAMVLKAPVGEILGPFKTEHGYHLLMVEKFIPDQLTSEKRQEILEQLFKEWLTRELKYMLHISYWVHKQDYH
jgi:uncharacterized membrane protein